MALFTRITEQGTLSEPDGVPNPRFALPGTVNWMRALAVLVDSEDVCSATAKRFYQSVNRPASSLSDKEENSVLEQLLFGLHQASALSALKQSDNPVDVMRVAIVAWYYGIYAAGSAMIVAQTKSIQADHSSTANVWSTEIAGRNLAMKPFDLRLPNLEKKATDGLLSEMRGGAPKYDLAGRVPHDASDANLANVAYLSGNADWWRWKAEQAVREKSAFKALGVNDFRKAAARLMRDQAFSQRSVGFLHLAYRYRGKANYREALFLGYGTEPASIADQFLSDLDSVLRAFLSCAGQFCARRLGNAVWSEFRTDLEEKRAFTLSPSDVWE